jgi:hypothetical protein
MAEGSNLGHRQPGLSEPEPVAALYCRIRVVQHRWIASWVSLLEFNGSDATVHADGHCYRCVGCEAAVFGRKRQDPGPRAARHNGFIVIAGPQTLYAQSAFALPSIVGPSQGVGREIEPVTRQMGEIS